MPGSQRMASEGNEDGRRHQGRCSPHSGLHLQVPSALESHETGEEGSRCQRMTQHLHKRWPLPATAVGGVTGAK